MKYNGITSKKQKSFHINAFDSGLNPEKDSYGLLSGELSKSVNLCYRLGALRTRPGLAGFEEGIIDDAQYASCYSNTVKHFDTKAVIDGKENHIVAECIYYDESSYVCIINIVGSDGSILKSSEILFSRTSSNVFYIPESIAVFGGKAQFGGGLFLVAEMVNCENYSQKDRYVYEINQSFTQWQRITTFYIPTVLVNGRGNKYNYAQTNDLVSLGAPKSVEKLNMLDGRFLAYYSSDGYSSSFQLPFSELANETVNCRIYYSLNSYTEWAVTADNTSDTKAFFSANVTMNVDRATGTVYFTTSSGEFEIPMMSQSPENNIKISAVKKTVPDLTDIAHSPIIKPFKRNIVIASGSRLFTVSYDNPLYFPIDSWVHIGKNDSDITALAVYRNSMLAFKSGEIYEVTVADGKLINTQSLLPYDSSLFYDNGNITVKCLTDKSGCSDSSSVAETGNTVFWKGTDGYFYKSIHSDKIPKCISQPVESYDDIGTGLSPGEAISRKNGCIYPFDNKALVIETQSDRTVLWVWEFPENIKILGGFTEENNTCFICQNTENWMTFIAPLSGDCDVIPTETFCDCVMKEMPIVSSMTTKSYSLWGDSSAFKLEKLFFRLSGKNVNISVNGRPPYHWIQSSVKKPFEGVYFYPGICRTDSVSISVSSSGPFALKDLRISCTGLEG